MRCRFDPREDRDRRTNSSVTEASQDTLLMGGTREKKTGCKAMPFAGIQRLATVTVVNRDPSPTSDNRLASMASTRTKVRAAGSLTPQCTRSKPTWFEPITVRRPEQRIGQTLPPPPVTVRICRLATLGHPEGRQARPRYPAFSTTSLTPPAVARANRMSSVLK